MTGIVYAHPTNTYNPADWDKGKVTLISSTHVQLSDGVHATDIYGTFSYDSSGVTGGTVTGMIWSLNGENYLIMYGMSVSILQVAFSSGAAIEALILRGNDFFGGSDANDTFYGYTGNDSYTGFGGIDTVLYNATKSSIRAIPNGNDYTVTAPGKTDSLKGIERVVAGNGSVLALDVKAGENTGSAYRAYQAAFDRKPDLAGLNYWVKQMDNGMSLKDVANGFVNSTEFKNLNPSTDPTAQINSYYQHVLHRTADATGFQYWANAMNNGMQAHEMLAAFSESAENIAATAPALNGGIWLS